MGCMEDDSMAQRVRQCIAESGRTQADVAAESKMSESALSKSLSGNRQFSTAEVARLSASLDVPLYWMITGRDDPAEPRLAARHGYDPNTSRYVLAGHADDRQTLADVKLLYQQAYLI